ARPALRAPARPAQRPPARPRRRRPSPPRRVRRAPPPPPPPSPPSRRPPTRPRLCRRPQSRRWSRPAPRAWGGGSSSPPTARPMPTATVKASPRTPAGTVSHFFVYQGRGAFWALDPAAGSSTHDWSYGGGWCSVTVAPSSVQWRVVPDVALSGRSLPVRLSAPARAGGRARDGLDRSIGREARVLSYRTIPGDALASCVSNVCSIRWFEGGRSDGTRR